MFTWILCCNIALANWQRPYYVNRGQKPRRKSVCVCVCVLLHFRKTKWHTFPPFTHQIAQTNSISHALNIGKVEHSFRCWNSKLCNDITFVYPLSSALSDVETCSLWNVRSVLPAIGRWFQMNNKKIISKMHRHLVIILIQHFWNIAYHKVNTSSYLECNIIISK